MANSDWIDRAAQLLDARKDQSQFRQRQVVKPIDAIHVEIDSVTYVNFSSNDYLGLTHHPKVLAATDSARHGSGAGAGAAGLICGHTDLHEQCEQTLALWKRTESAILLPSGYQ